jgi:hypothetical protein
MSLGGKFFVRGGDFDSGGSYLAGFTTHMNQNMGEPLRCGARHQTDQTIEMFHQVSQGHSQSVL